MLLAALAKRFFRRNVFVFNKEVSQRSFRHPFFTARGGTFR
jgi:hypothetical protein